MPEDENPWKGQFGVEVVTRWADPRLVNPSDKAAARSANLDAPGRVSAFATIPGSQRGKTVTSNGYTLHIFPTEAARTAFCTRLYNKGVDSRIRGISPDATED